MVELRLPLHTFQFEIGAQTRKQMIPLRCRGARRRTLQRDVLLQRFVILLDTPSSLIEFLSLVRGKRQVACYLIEYACGVVFVYEDLFGQMQWEWHFF